MTTFVSKRYVHLNRSGSDQSTFDAAEAYVTGTFRVGGDITLGDESTDLIHVTGAMRVSGTLDVGYVGTLPDEVGFFVSGSPGSRGTGNDPTVALFGGDVHISGNLTVDGTSPSGGGASGVQYANFLTGFGEGATAGDLGVWRLSNDPLSGKDEWSVGLIFTRNNTGTGDAEQRIWSTSDEYLNYGATFVMKNGGIQPTLYVDTGQLSTNDAGSSTRNKVNTVFAVLVYNGGNVKIYINGAEEFAGGSDSDQAYASNPYGSQFFSVGASGYYAGNTSYGAEDWGVHAVCYVTRSLGEPEVLEWWRHAYVSGTLIDVPDAPGNGLNAAWRVTDSNPSGGTWTPFIGTDSLFKSGSKAHSVKSIPIKW